MNQQAWAYLHWCQLRGVKFPQQHIPDTPPASTTTLGDATQRKLLFLSHSDEINNLETPQGALFHKIIGAMKLSDCDYIVVCSDDLAASHLTGIAQLIICLGEVAFAQICPEQVFHQSKGKVIHHENTQILPTYHPVEMLSDPQLKIPTWRDLQKALRIVGP